MKQIFVNYKFTGYLIQRAEIINITIYYYHYYYYLILVPDNKDKFKIYQVSIMVSN